MNCFSFSRSSSTLRRLNRHMEIASSCVSHSSSGQDVWSLGMVLYYLSTGGTPYFPSPVERTEAAISQFREQSQQTLTDDNFCVDLKSVRGSAWRCSLGLALVTSVDERGTASEVLEAFTRGIQGLVSTVSKTRGMENLQRKLAEISEGQQEVLRQSGTISGNVGRVLQEQLDLRRRVTAMSTVLEHLAMDEMRMPHSFLVLPEKPEKLRRPKQWFADRGRLHFVCAHGLELAPCGENGTGFLVSQPKVIRSSRDVWCGCSIPWWEPKRIGETQGGILWSFPVASIGRSYPFLREQEGSSKSLVHEEF